ncbi:MAG: geranylgeranyl reductase family protein [Desulfovibrio sp.]
MDRSNNASASFDALVVGAGPAGSAAARTLALGGLRVALLDRARFPRPKLCGGLLTKKTLRALDSAFALTPEDLTDLGVIFGKSVEYSLFHRDRHLLSGTAPYPFHFVSRTRLDHLLLRRAELAGAQLVQARAIDCNPQQGTVATEDGRCFRARFIIGADGANSRMRRALHPDKRRWRTNLADSIELRIPRECVSTNLRDLQTPLLHLGFNRAGYGWVFPNPEHLVIGMCGLREEKPLRACLQEYLEALHICTDQSPPLQGHPLPYGNWLKISGRGPLLLAGDAAGLVEPTLGEGIFYALMSGKYAALSVLDETRNTGRADTLYRRRLEKNIFPELKASNALRKILLTAVNIHGYAPISLFLRAGGKKLAEMVHGERSYALLRKKHWEWE